MKTQEDLKGWELIDVVAQGMSENGETNYFKTKLVESIEAQNIDVETIDIKTLRFYALKILSQSMSKELLSG